MSYLLRGRPPVGKEEVLIAKQGQTLPQNVWRYSNTRRLPLDLQETHRRLPVFLFSLFDSTIGFTSDQTKVSLHCSTDLNRSCRQASQRISTLVLERVREQALSVDGKSGYYPGDPEGKSQHSLNLV